MGRSGGRSFGSSLAGVSLTREVWQHPMSIEWNVDAISSFFGALPEEVSAINSADRIFVFTYKGLHLRYEAWVHADAEAIFISADTVHPFDADSLYEIYLPCDSLSLVQDGYYPGQLALACWYGPQDDQRNRRLMILKRPDGDLKVWPAFPFPEGHAFAAP